jgi:nucleotide-binding universal stress UspA family protein
MKLIVGYLSTSGGADAVALGVRLARTIGAQLEICLVLPQDKWSAAMTGAGSPSSYDAAMYEKAEHWLSDALALVPDDVTAHAHVSFADSFAQGLITEVARFEAAALVVGGSGGGIAGRHSLGSVVNELLHSSPVPVAVAPRELRESPVERVREVTCALGEREGADLLLNTAVWVSRTAGIPLRLASLVELDPVLGILRGDDDAVHQYALSHARNIVDTAKGELPEGFPVTGTVVDGVTVEEAVAKLDWQDGDLIMVGSSRLSMPRRLFLGSTAAKMLRVLEVPIVMVPRDQLSEEELL